MKVLKLWRLARSLNRAADRGEIIITVPRWLAPELQKLMRERKIERAQEKWAQRTAEVPLPSWQRAMNVARYGESAENLSRDIARAQYGDLCPECSIAWDQPSPGCPHRIWDLHPLSGK